MICKDCKEVALTERHKIGVCRSCYVKRVVAKRKKPPLNCKECNVEISCRTKSLLCRECYFKEYYSKEENLKRKNETTKKWNEQNKERRREISIQWQKANPERTREIRAKTVRGDRNRFTRAKYRAQKRGFEWDIPYEQFLELTKKDCFYCSQPINLSGVGLDRKDNKKGYTLENSVPCCGPCNRVKSDIFTHDEMLVAMNAVLKFRKKNLIKAINDG